MTEYHSPGLEDVIAARTKISSLDTERERIVVRGYDLIELAREVRYTDVAHLLIRGHLPSAGEQAVFCDAIADQAGLPDGVIDILRRFPKGMSAMDAQRTGLSLLAGYEPPELLADNSPEANERKAIRLLARAPTVTVNAFRALHEQPVVEPNPALGFAASFLHMIYGRAPAPAAVQILDRILTCYAEHELAASTFAARVAASTLTDIYGAVVAACAALKGPLHGGANEAAARMFGEIAASGGPAVAELSIRGRLEAGQRIMGFGHRVYMDRPDPRAVLLKADVDDLASRDPELAPLGKTYDIVVETMAREKGLHPNADLPTGLLLSMLNVPIDLFTPIFLCARIAGVAAHVLEQHADNRLYRPRVLYEGPNDLTPPEGFTPSRC